jgi:dihydroneopterin aldolase
MDIIFVKNLQLQAVIGCLPWERAIKQALLLSIELKVNTQTISQTDDIEQALDYAKICQRITAFVERSEYKLIETLAENIAQLLQTEFSVTALCLTLEKPGALPNAQTVGVKLERGL